MERLESLHRSHFVDFCMFHNFDAVMWQVAAGFVHVLARELLDHNI